MSLDERKKRILQAIVDSYIASAEPVGSRFLARRYDLGVSPATIRNEMADLEEMGYLEQPHTSSGRIPSDKGYRFYVDFLLDIHLLADQEIKRINQWYQSRVREIDLQIQRTAKIISQVTQYTSVVMGPSLSEQKLNYLQLLPVGAGSAVVVLVDEAGIVEHRTVDIPSGISEEELSGLTKIMNERLKGRTLEEVKTSLMRELNAELTGYMDRYQLVQDIIEQLVLAMDETIWENQEEKVYLGGTTNILNQPEFRNIEKARQILSLLEEERALHQALSELAPEGITIRIGKENSLAEMSNCSMITARYEIEGKTVGSIGVLGPTRMDYSHVVSVLNVIAKNLNRSLSSKRDKE